jgi:thiol:disulfide interchange protein DsbC
MESLLMPKIIYPLIAAAGLACVVLLSVSAQSPKSDPRAEVAGKLPGNVKPGELTATDIPGIWELQRGMEIGYVTADGRYFFSGELHNLKTEVNLTERRRGEIRSRILADVPERDMMVFGPDTPAHAITVFTDVDCGYCRKLHEDLPELNRLGIQVRYLFYPRAGPGSETWKKTENIWCAPDRKEALARAVRGERIHPGKCDASAIARHFELGRKLDVQGTPGIYTPNGRYLPGYLPPAQMLEHVRHAMAN